MMFGKRSDLDETPIPSTSTASLFGGLLDFSHGLLPGLPDLAKDYGPSSQWFAPAVCTWLAATYSMSCIIGKRFEWKPVQVLQVYRSVQCMLFAGVGLFSMGVLHGQGISLSAQCNDDVFIAAIINFFLWYFVADLFIMVVLLQHWRVDLLIHHGVALCGIVSLVANKLYPCSSAPVAVTELISLFSGVEAMLPNPKLWSRGEEHAFYVIRTYRLGILVVLRPFLWQHVRLSANTASTPLQAAIYMIPGTVLPLLDLVWAYKIVKSLLPKDKSKALGAVSGSGKEGHKNGNSAAGGGDGGMVSFTSPVVRLESRDEALPSKGD